MTTIAEEKAKREQELKDAPKLVTSVRLEVIQKAELANAMKAETDEGLSDPYPVLAEFYGKQRAILKGLTALDIMKFDLPTTSVWNSGTNFTFPSETQFGYEFYDLDGDVGTIDDATKYYLVKNKTGNVPCTLEGDANAFVYPVPLVGYVQVIAKSDGVVTAYDFDLQTVPVPNSIKIYHGETLIGQDDGEGNITGTNITGSTVDYDTYEVDLNYSAAPTEGTIIKFVYDSYSNEDGFTEDYEQVNFTLGTKSYGSGLTLKLMNIAADVLDERLQLLDQMLLRKKSDHQVVGKVVVLCEGLAVDPSWVHLTGDPEDTTLLDHSGFKSLLGYLSPDVDNDLSKSANPYTASTGRKVGLSYPDIEKNPMFPCTDGDYTGKAAFTGNFVHLEDTDGDGTAEDPKWSVHADIKWQYGTAPASLGETAQEDPDSFLAALQAINAFTGSAGNNPIPTDGTGSGGSPAIYYTYSMGYGGSDNDYVHENKWTWDEASTAYVQSDNGRYSCYFNSVQALKDNHLTHLQTQCGLIATLGDTSNTIDTDRQTGDTQFITDTATFKTALDGFLSYHDGFDPISTRPTYDTSEMTTLQTAANATGGYEKKTSDRMTDLDTVIGTPVTSGYSKVIYDSCDIAVRKDIGYLRDVIDQLNSIADVYDLIDTRQAEYAMYP